MGLCRSLGRVRTCDAACRYGYVTFVLKTQQSFGYLGIGFGELPVLMIPGDGVWGWMDGSGAVSYTHLTLPTIYSV